MKILLISPNDIKGYVPDNYPNMRVEFCWAKALNACMMPYGHDAYRYEADVVFFILPKHTEGRDPLASMYAPKLYREQFPNAKIGLIQEGPVDYYLNWTAHGQFTYLNKLSEVDFLCAHNEADKLYLKNFNDNVYVFPTIYDGTQIPDKHEDRQGVMISGNTSSWYGGTFGMYEAKKHTEFIYLPNSGRVNSKEIEDLHKQGIDVLQRWLLWTEWMRALNHVKLGINLMPIRAAGTFALNCASLGIPCIGFDDLDTQKHHHPKLAVCKNNYRHASRLIEKCLTDQNFYNSVIPDSSHKKYTVENIRGHFSEIVQDILK